MRREVFKFCCIFLLLLMMMCSGCSSLNHAEQNDIMFDYLRENGVIENGKAEIVFLLDRSGSVGAANFEIEKGFVESFLTHIVVDVNASRVAVVSYSETAECHIDFLRTPKSKCYLSQELEDVVFRDSSTTNIAAALIKAGEIFQYARPDIRKVIVLISDGLHTAGGDPSPHAQRLREEGVEIFCFGIGHFHKTELLAMASSPQHVYKCNKFNEFQILAKKIRGDPNEASWSGESGLPNCDYLCDGEFKGGPSSPGCCDYNARCSCALLAGMYTCVCGPGYFGLSGLEGQCRPCPFGTYKSNLEPSSACVRCPPGSDTEQMASKSIKDCVCKKGFRGNPDQGIPCTPIKCPPLQAPTDGYILGNCPHTYWSECTFLCKDGYELADKSSLVRTCLSNGSWSGTNARCLPLRCPPLKIPMYGRKICEEPLNALGSKCIFGCLRGFILEGSRERQCRNTKVWSGKETICTPISCNLPPPIPNGKLYSCKLDTKPEMAETCAYQCNYGYELRGPSFLSCYENGKLLDYQKQETRPECVDVTPPEIICPESVVQPNEKRKNGALVSWSEPQPTDNSGKTPKLLVTPSFLRPPVYLKLGIHTIQYTAIDGTGLKAFCEFIVAVYDADPPVVLECPSDMNVMADGIEKIVFWSEPIFQDNSDEKLRIRNSSYPGQTFQLGTHTVIYEASDSRDNVARCEFHVVVVRNKCPYHPPPDNGAFTCNDFMSGQFCQAYCNEKYDFVRKPADWYICSSEAHWLTLPAGTPVPWPDCAQPHLPGSIQHMLKGYYYAGNCNDPVVQNRIKKMFLSHLVTSFEEGQDCVKNAVCSFDSVKVRCGRNLAEGKNRIRRDLLGEPEELELEFEINFREEGLEEALVKDLMEGLREAEHSLLYRMTNVTFSDNDDRSIPDDDVGRFVITEGKTVVICNPGSIPVGNICVLCAHGTYYDKFSKECLNCPVGQYSELEGQLLCQMCPDGTSTIEKKAKSINDCKKICDPGTYSFTGMETCLACPLGSFQENNGRTTCVLCPNGTFTASVGTTSKLDCRPACVPGTFSENGLEPCDNCSIGFYQSSIAKISCDECPQNLSTIVEGSTSQSSCIELDPCSDEEICQNGGLCNLHGREKTCQCHPGFEGINCELDVNECNSDPCLNTGICINTIGSFYCHCEAGFEGNFCEVEVNECIPSPCMNNGTCLDKVNDYACVCPSEFEGRHCDISVEMCLQDSVCTNGGTCINDAEDNSFCACQPGYTGFDCSMNIDECQNISCNNHGRCEDSIASYHCACHPGFEGLQCETNIDECQSNPCSEGSICQDLVDEYKCHCPPGRNGTHCENKPTDDFILHFPTTGATIANMASLNIEKAMSNITVSLWLQTNNDAGRSGTPFSYATMSANGLLLDNALTIKDCSGIQVFINNEQFVTDMRVDDGKWHHLVFVWSSEGNWSFYKDGELNSLGTASATKDIPGGGILVLGQEQDIIGGGFSPRETFSGNITRVNIWDSCLSVENVTRLYQLEDDIPGKLVAWPDFLRNVEGHIRIHNHSKPEKYEDSSTPYV